MMNSESPWTKRAKIVATLGPATDKPELVEALILAGVNVFRLNFSHGGHDDHALRIQWIREASARLDQAIAVMLDLQGPKIRTGPLAGGGPVELRDGAFITITTDPVEGTAQEVSTSYPHLPADVNEGDPLLISDGRLAVRVYSVAAPKVHCVVERGGMLRERQGINIPGGALSMPSMTVKDEEDLAFGLDLGVDCVALSYVRRAADLQMARDYMQRHGRSVPLIVKVETAQAAEHLEEVVAASDGVMVARGDLGVEVGPERVPILQKRMVHQARILGLPCIIATQMLESLMEESIPSRAEVSDVANAAWEGGDALMLSGETAVGRHPVLAVETMARIIAEAESFVRPSDFHEQMELHPQDASKDAQAISHAAHSMADDLEVRAIAGLTRTGRVANLLSAYRPGVPIYAFTPDEQLYRWMALRWGVQPLHCEVQESADAMLAQMEAQLLSRGLVQSGDTVLVVGSMPLRAGVRTNFLKVHPIGNSG